MSSNVVFALDGEALVTGTITPTTSAGGFTTAVLNAAASNGLQCKAALITVEVADINFTLDGTAPSAAAGTNVGHQMAASQSFIIRGWNNVRKFSCINRVASSGAIVKYTLFY